MAVISAGGTYSEVPCVHRNGSLEQGWQAVEDIKPKTTLYSPLG